MNTFLVPDGVEARRHPAPLGLSHEASRSNANDSTANKGGIPMNRLHNPDSVAAPFSNYSQGVEMMQNAHIMFVAGPSGCRS